MNTRDQHQRGGGVQRGVVPGVDTALAFMRQRFGVLAK